MHRRDFLRTAGTAAGGAAAAGAVGSAGAQEGGGAQPDYGGWFSDVSNFSSTVDRRGEDEVTIEVGVEANGNYWGFGPAAVWVDPETTVIWEWTGRGNAHNVVADDDSFSSGSPTAEAGTTYEQTFSEAGIQKYYCNPHLSAGMKGAVVVGEDVPTVAADAATPVNPEHMGVPFQPHYVGIATLLGISSTLAFTFYLLKYGESAHTSGGNN
ncbi:Halocyanin-like protein [Halorhabdus tiamatea SARL4B]|uniref:Halocyanin-like protein n=1 Tax=Halorhabdus tiamatea SARL4B TaxID=1033806 RepID=F7PLB9_9EURY|nr:halocyanin domain-containing protein [Halorhabdus tiamatea]ERJ05169.1 Halocyanin-like protein [Halorhabdus tiamatea SARL4B]CCQ34721.1 halocyanin precursor-like protein [Halorhabdus tiamatea SARL4B]